MGNPYANRVKPAVILGTLTFGYRVLQARIKEPTVVQQILDLFRGFGHDELDTARMYCEGTTEELLGDLAVQTNQKFKLATKVYPEKSGDHQPENLSKIFQESLKALKVQKVDIFYLHAPDHTTPIDLTLKGVQQLYTAGRFKEFGLSNYTSWQVTEIYYLCKQNGYILPTVYQGMVNCITREIEQELLPALRRFGIRFYAYNPLAGGLFAGKFKSQESQVEEGSRFDPNTPFGNIYRKRFGQEAHFEAYKIIADLGAKHNITPIEAALRWINHHSKLEPTNGDGIIIGASSIEHAQKNLESLEKGPLPEDILQAIDTMWLKAKPYSAPYFR
ncbi:hypothetical protein G9A89_018521 [Geosiphon pyriformis]|nr:hypothetical protein G9A89_018521 [Geosiphon pyriformis]